MKLKILPILLLCLPISAVENLEQINDIKFFAHDDLNGDGEKELIIVGHDQSLSYFLKEEGRWLLSSYIERIDNEANVDITSDFFEFKNYENPKEIIPIDLDGKKGKELILPLVGNNFYGAVIFAVDNDQIVLLIKVLGFQGIIDINGDKRYELYAYGNPQGYYGYSLNSKSKYTKFSRLPKHIFDALIRQNKDKFYNTFSFHDFKITMERLEENSKTDAEMWYYRERSNIINMTSEEKNLLDNFLSYK